jgi:hypothetical protein
LDVVDAKETGLPLMLIGEDEGAEADWLGRTPLDVDRVSLNTRSRSRSESRIIYRDTIDGIVGGTNECRGGGSELVPTRVGEKQAGEGAVRNIVVVRGVIVATDGVVLGAEGVIVTCILVKHCGCGADEAVLLVVCETQDGVEDILRVDD